MKIWILLKTDLYIFLNEASFEYLLFGNHFFERNLLFDQAQDSEAIQDHQLGYLWSLDICIELRSHFSLFFKSL